MTRAIAVAAGALALQGCSGSARYDVLATVIDGRLAFISADPEHRCIADVDVVASDVAARETPVPGDDAFEVAQGAWWRTIAAEMDCTADFPVFYGAAPPGARQTVSPKPLRTGLVYFVHTAGESGVGIGCFEIVAGRRVRNNLPCYGPPES